MLLSKLKSIGVEASNDYILDVTTAELLASELNHTVNVIEEESIEKLLNTFNDKPVDLIKRTPVVAIMGHVDHGKTSLLDTIRKTNVVKGEVGGITQHIGAYQIYTDKGDPITFLDTPGHEAFDKIRSRGSKLTDIILLVIAADDGLKPQTIEAINHAHTEEVPIIVVINKIDKSDINIPKIKADLLQNNVILEEIGGDTLLVEISVKNTIGIDKLIDTILLQADLLELKTNPVGRAKGTIIEVTQKKGIGFLATILLERGTLNLSDSFTCGTQIGKVKMIINDQGKRLKSAGPYLPVEISGFNNAVEAGDSFLVVEDEKQALELADYRIQREKQLQITKENFDLTKLLSDSTDDMRVLSVIIKADTQGSLEAIISSLEGITNDLIKINVILGGLGEITESDINFANVSNAVVFGFNTRANNNAKELSKKYNIELRYHSIIYKIIDDVKMIMSGMLDPEIVENIIGYANVKQVFSINKLGNIAGCVVTEGIIKKAAFVRLLRNNVVLYDDVLSQLKHFKDDVKEVKSGTECGIAFANYDDILAGDIIECYEKSTNQQVVR